jgi:hypothetical protein
MTQVGILADADGILHAGVDSVCRVDVGVRPSQPFVFTGWLALKNSRGGARLASDRVVPVSR